MYKSEKIYIPSSITRIGIGAFKKCDSISEVVIAPGAKESYRCFDDTPFFKNKDNWEDGGLYVGETLAAYDRKFEGVAVIKQGTQSIARSAFVGCRISGVVFPESLKTIECGAFWDCQNLAEIDLPKNITNIGERAFEGCSNLETVTIRSAIKVLAEYTFSGCKSLKNIQLPASLREIEGKCFRDCKSLETVVLPQKFQTIHPGSFDGCTLRSLTIPESARNIAPPISSERYSHLETHTLGFAGMLIIRCKEGSYAEQYAKEYGIGYELV